MNTALCRAYNPLILFTYLRCLVSHPMPVTLFFLRGTGAFGGMLQGYRVFVWFWGFSEKKEVKRKMR